MAALELAQDLPSQRRSDKGETKVETDRDEVVGVALRLHSPSDGLTEGLNISMIAPSMSSIQIEKGGKHTSTPRRIPTPRDRLPMSVAYCPTSQYKNC